MAGRHRRQGGPFPDDGPGRITDLPVLGVVSASHLITDLILGAPDVVHDYLDRS
ncbi:hypothetical protein AB0H51_21815 [Streptomyces griseoluteus]|uniref:hypothetical protein n=1 Tax=Streptomyces griseoluteus TaxID=29306 RepID=UPI0033C13101